MNNTCNLEIYLCSYYLEFCPNRTISRLDINLKKNDNYFKERFRQSLNLIQMKTKLSDLIIENSNLSYIVQIKIIDKYIEILTKTLKDFHSLVLSITKKHEIWRFISVEIIREFGRINSKEYEDILIYIHRKIFDQKELKT